ncbi:hypothetical protein [Aureliella helgolandensis]|uniref:Tail terminator n=1 Tax=Aureliella helgolandensis TaxID=2527968 RepID=A0A518GEA7_9BACT|nr:hypothetical protein [Aureliella helgolandensis]QDV26934.1 hypothetical protein Q31a_53140 [Aureliella helgolandensis]
MPTPIQELTIALQSAIAAELSIVIERRKIAYFTPGEVREGKYIIVGIGEDTNAKRGIDLLDLQVDLGYQIALPEPTESNPDPANNIPWSDEQEQKVDAIKQLFRPDGALRDRAIAGVNYLRMQNTPIYRPDMLLDNQIFTSVIRLEFRSENE